ncbi:MAG: PAS domain S-box protein [Bacteroidetes bacterium]|nr:PAS domain S-box protein [Bacteroidota bacterium]
MKSFKISIRRSAFFILIVTAALSIFSISALWVYTEIKKSKDNIKTIQDTYETEQQEIIKSEVKRIVALIEFSRINSKNKSTEELKNEVLNYVSSIRLQHGGYIFINTYTGKALVFDGVKIIGEKDVTNMIDPDGQRIFDIELESIKKTDGDFFWYRFKRLDSFSPVPKVSYVYGYDDWGWIIGAGVYLDDISAVVQNKKNQYQAILFKKILYIVLLFIVLLLALLAVSFYLSGYIRKEFAVFTSFFHKNPKENSIIEYKKLHIEEFKGLAHSANIMIKQRRVAEKLLKKERDKAHKYLNVAGVIILALDDKGIVTLINKKGCETLGYNEEEILGKNWFNHFIPLSEKQKLYNSFSNIMNGNNEVDFTNDENKIISADGYERLISWKNTILHDDNGTIIGSLSSGLDITESKQVEASFFESEQKYKLLFEKTSDPVLIIGKDNTFINCNDAALRILGLDDKTEIIGTYPREISPEEQSDGMLSEDKAHEMIINARKHGFTRFEWLHQNKNNEPFYVDVSLTAIPISGVEYLYVVWRNITEKKKQDEELLLAKEKAEQSDNIKTSFLHNMQHEIRTPLNAMMGFTQLLKLSDLSKSEKDDFHDSIIKSGHQLSKIIDKIIDFSRLQSGDILITNKTVELKKLISDIFIKYNHTFQNTSINFTINSYNSLYNSIVKMDAYKVIEIIDHLLDNAIKFTETGSVELAYYIKDQYIIFEITDTGVGIEERHFKSIFGRFNRLAHKNSEKLYGGNGLGLSISKAVLGYLGGTIWVESQVGKGSKFSFSIPYKPIEIDAINVKNSMEDSTVTIVTNTKTMFDSISKIIADFGTKAIHVKSGIEAIELCQNNYETNLMIIDIDLEGMNGITTTKAIKAFNKRLPIVAYIGADTTKLTKEDALLAGCSDYITESMTEKIIMSTLYIFLVKKVGNI